MTKALKAGQFFQKHDSIEIMSDQSHIRAHFKAFKTSKSRRFKDETSGEKFMTKTSCQKN